MYSDISLKFSQKKGLIHMDVLTKEQRHKAMTNIHSKDTSIEIKLRKALWHKGYRYRKNYKLLPGSPDIVLTKYKIAVFCDSEFFHGKDWELVLRPRLLKSRNGEYWIKKILHNMERDIEVDKQLLFLGWTVVHFWGADINKRVDECVQVIDEYIFDIKIQSCKSIYDDLLDEQPDIITMLGQEG